MSSTGTGTEIFVPVGRRKEEALLCSALLAAAALNLMGEMGIKGKSGGEKRTTG